MLKDAHAKTLNENHLLRENQELREIIAKNMNDKEEILERRLQKLNINVMRKLEQNQDKIDSLRFMSPQKSEMPTIKLKTIDPVSNAGDLSEIH